MIDCNHHIHSPTFLDLAAEGLPDGLNTVLFDNMEVSYKANDGGIRVKNKIDFWAHFTRGS